MNRLKKNIPNCITSLRITGAIILLFLDPREQESAFLIVYTICGVTDALDGATARLLGASSPFGARLDSISDLIFYSAMLSRVLPVIWAKLSTLTLAIAGISILIRIVSYVTAAIKYKLFSSMHTYANKLTGLCVFLLPYLTLWLHLPEDTVGLIIAVIGLLATLEEFFIHLTSEQYNPNRKTILMRSNAA